MDFVRSIPSSIRSKFGMGNDSSSQRVPESSVDARATEVFDPDNIPESDDEDRTIQSQFAPAVPKPEPNLDLRAEPPPSAVEASSGDESRSKSRKKRGRKRRSRIGSEYKFSDERQSYDESPADDTNEDVGSTIEVRPAIDHEPAEGTKLPEEGVIYPHLSGEAEPENTQDGIQSEHSTSDDQPAEVVTRSSPLQIRSKEAKPRYACPHANSYDCNKTFASQSIAQRHGLIHMPHEDIQCPVCGRSYSRADKLRKHKLIHTRSEIEAAIVAQEARQLNEALEEPVETAQMGDSVDGSEAEDGQTNHSPVDGLQEPSQDVTTTSPVVPQNDTTHTPPSSVSLLPSAELNGKAEDAELVQETPRPRSRLKRKRDMQSPAQLNQRATESLHKRRRRHSLSPPSSVTSQEGIDNSSMSNNNSAEDKSEQIAARAAKITKVKSTRMGNLDNFAKPWTPGSQLHHPIHNPRSPRVGIGSKRVEVLIPQTSHAGPSTKARTRNQKALSTHEFEDTNSEQTPLAGKGGRIVVISPKGKRKAINGVTYSSPLKATINTDEDDQDSDFPEPVGMATSVARRGGSSAAGKKRPRQTLHDDDVDDSTGTPSQTDTKIDTKPFRCQECGQKFSTRDLLRKHEKRPNVHSADHECEDCSQTFSSFEKLKVHQQTADHGDGTGEQGRKGKFSQREVQKLQNWRDHFCEEYDINISTFNQMMTDSCRREKSFQWPYRYISRAELTKEYFDILPDRNRRSMARYREREFQNVPGKQEWTEEDDEELMQLVKEHGQKWVEIGQRMTRTQDSVSQRWRFKLKWQETAHQGEWMRAEEQKLKDVVAQVKRESGLPLDFHADIRFPWESVSKKMKGVRTPQQCSNKWRLMHLTRRGNIFVKPENDNRKFSTSPQATTPSKMSQRLAGQTPSNGRSGSSSKKRIVSAKRVQESDDEDEIASKVRIARQERSNSDIEQDQNNDELNFELADSETPMPRLRPSLSRTPQTGKGLSQAFAQTQANTSTLRAPNTTNKPHTQTEMPTPGLIIGDRPRSSPWRAINSDDPESTGLMPINEDDIMAEPQSSGADSPSSKSASYDGFDKNSSESTSPEDSEVDEDARNHQVDAEVASRASSPDTSSSQSDESFDSQAEDSDDSVNAKDAQKNLFVQTLRPSMHNSPPTSRSGAHWRRRKPMIPNLADVLRGDATVPQDGSDNDDSDTSDDGDIPYK